MYSLMKLFLSLSLVFGGINGVMGSNKLSQTKKIPKLFVFGDSYADTGNTKHTGNIKQDAECWFSPYGITFPGKPSGRFSDGLISTDFLAKVLGAEPPYNYKTHGTKKGLKRGMNFAYGAAGVFNSPTPNLTAQINFLVDLEHAGHVYTPEDFTPSDVSFISYTGGDYFDFIAENRSSADMKPFVEKVVDYLYVKMGGLLFKKIAITSVPPIGCLPGFTSASSYQRCDESHNAMVNLHNILLKQVVVKLNKDSKLKKSGKQYFIIDIHKAFMTILKNNGGKRFKNVLKPCCEGDCARVDTKGAKKYTLCDDPKSSFFWDIGQPTQEGWRSIFSLLGNPLSGSLTKA